MANNDALGAIQRNRVSSLGPLSPVAPVVESHQRNLSHIWFLFSPVNLAVGCFHPRRIWCCIVVNTKNGVPIVGIILVSLIRRSFLLICPQDEFYNGHILDALQGVRSHVCEALFIFIFFAFRDWSLILANVAKTVIRRQFLHASGSWASGRTYAARWKGKFLATPPPPPPPPFLFPQTASPSY